MKEIKEEEERGWENSHNIKQNSVFVFSMEESHQLIRKMAKISSHFCKIPFLEPWRNDPPKKQAACNPLAENTNRRSASTQDRTSGNVWKDFLLSMMLFWMLIIFAYTSSIFYEILSIWYLFICLINPFSEIPLLDVHIAFLCPGKSMYLSSRSLFYVHTH